MKRLGFVWPNPYSRYGIPSSQFFVLFSQRRHFSYPTHLSTLPLPPHPSPHTNQCFNTLSSTDNPIEKKKIPGVWVEKMKVLERPTVASCPNVFTQRPITSPLSHNYQIYSAGARRVDWTLARTEISNAIKSLNTTIIALETGAPVRPPLSFVQ